MFNKNYILNFGPQHPAAHGVLRLLLELEGERVITLDPHIGFLHRGTEKLIENKFFSQTVPYFDRLDYVSMMSQEHGFVMTLETLAGVSVPKKTQIIRVLFDELTRLLNHIMCITTHALDVGALTPFLWGFEEREKLIQFYELVSGARMHAGYYRIGGVTSDLPSFFFEKVADFVHLFWDYINILDDLLTENIIWKSRLIKVGSATKKTAINSSFSGPMLRASGIPWDLRKVQPYEAYSIFSFDIPFFTDGDSYSRYLVRLHEMRESLFIINQAIFFLSNFSFFSFDFFYHNRVNSLSYNFSKHRSKSSMEEMIFNFKSYSNGNIVNKGKISSYVEAPKGETGVYVISNNTSFAQRCKIKAPGYIHLQALDILAKNLMISDVVTIIGSLDIVFGEIDR